MPENLTEAELKAIAIALQYSIDNGLADDYEDIEALFGANEKFKALHPFDGCSASPS